MVPERFASTSTERLPFHQSSASRPDPPGWSSAASSASTPWTLTPRPRAVSTYDGGTALSMNHANMSPTAGCPASQPYVPGMTPSATTPHIPSIGRASSASRMWHVLVPMIATSVPGRVTVAAGTETWASTLATATGVPGRSPVQAAASAVSPAARWPVGTISGDILSSTTDPKPGSSGSKNERTGNSLSADQMALYPAVQLL